MHTAAETHLPQPDRTGELTRLFEEQYHPLYACAFRMAGNHDDAEDILQNAWLRACRGLSGFRGDASLQTWLYRIVVNESKRFSGKLKKLPLTLITEKLGVSESEFFESLAWEPDLDSDLVYDELREKCLQAFLKCLPHQQRVCFLLHSVMQLPHGEIAQILDISPENVRVTLHRGRKRLQELFNERCSLIDPKKPCQCHLWLKYMKDHQLPLPSGYGQFRQEELRSQHFRNMHRLRQLDRLYAVEARISREEFMSHLKKIVPQL